MKRLSTFLFATIVFALLFSVSSIKLVAGIEVLAFPLTFVFTAAFFYVAVVKLLRQKRTKLIATTRKMLEYIPFVALVSFILRRAGESETSYALDFVSVALWALLLVVSLFSLHFLNDKRSPFGAQNAEKPRGLKRVGVEILEWIDAFVQSAFVVSLVNIFIFQLYGIPSESMVPQFLIGDRVVVLKPSAGPSFPLSSVSLPQLRDYKRGDIVVFRNPHLEGGRKNETKHFLSQLVYMMTFSLVNLNYDENGNQIADPLVKRVTGVPGEQLMMVDGVLYARTSASEDFAPVLDEEKYAKWNLAELDAETKASVRYFPLEETGYDVLLQVESMRSALDLDAAKAEALSLATRFSVLRSKVAGKNDRSFAGDWRSVVGDENLWIYRLFSNSDEITRKLLTTDGGERWFTAFMTDWMDSCPKGGELAGGNLYDDSMFRLNVLVKLTFGRLVVRNTELLSLSSSGAPSSRDEEKLRLLETAQSLYYYTIWTDSRNMPQFPLNDDGSAAFIPSNCYFMMGDNRFNSLDMRHSYEEFIAPISELDSLSVTYRSRMAPQYVSARRILGTTALRFWPLKRFGLLKVE